MAHHDSDGARRAAPPRGRTKARPAVAPPEEDPNATVICSSPPCFLHELDPSYLGYLGRDEVRTLVEESLAAARCCAPPGSAEELSARLRRHADCLGGPSGREGAGVPSGEPFARRLREALPRIHDEALRRDLTELLVVLERDLQAGQG